MVPIEIKLAYKCVYKHVLTKNGNNYSLLIKNRFSVWLALCEPNKFEHCTSPSWASPLHFGSSGQHAHLSFKVSGLRQLWCWTLQLRPEESMDFHLSNPKIFSISHSPYLFGCIYFRLDLLTDKFSVSKFLFSILPVGISPSVCSFSSSSAFVLIGLYPFLSDVSGFSISKSLSSSILPSSFSDSDSDFRVRFWIIFSSHSGCSGVFHSIERIFRRRLGSIVGSSA